MFDKKDLDIAVNQEVMALTLSLFRIGLEDETYNAGRVSAGIEKDTPNNASTITYWFDNVLLYKVHIKLWKHPSNEDLQTTMEILDIPERSVRGKSLLKDHRVIAEMYKLLGEVTRRHWMHNRAVNDKVNKCTRNW